MAVSNRISRWRALRAVLFGLIFGLLNWNLGRIYIQKEMACTRAGQIEKEFSQSRGQSETLTMGDPHMVTGFDPRFFSGSFNFAE
jgi:hypothetical protein